MVYGFKDRRIAQALKQVGLERLTQPQMGLSVEYPERKNANLRGYIVVPNETIPAAKRVKVGGKYTVRLGKGKACLYKRNRSGTGLDLVPMLDESGKAVQVDIYNPCPTKIVPETVTSGSGEACDEIGCPDDELLFVTQDLPNGDFYITERCSFPCTSESVSTSTSEPSTSVSTSIDESTSLSTSQPSTSDGSTSQPSTSISTSETSTSQPSTSVSTSTSGSEDCSYTGTVRTISSVTCQQQQICFGLQDMRFENGKLCEVTSAGEKCCTVNDCCSYDESGSGSGSGTGPDSDSAP